MNSDPQQRRIHRQRWAILRRLERWLDLPLLVLSFVWLGLLIAELVSGIGPMLETLSWAIWLLFVLNFLLEFSLAPAKMIYLRRNWLTVVSLLLPALRIIRVARVVRAMRAARAVRGLRLVRLFTSINRGMRTLGRTMRKRGMRYVLGLSIIVVLSGAAGMYAFENEVPGGPDSYGAALWWTAMLLISIGSEYWPQTPEGRLLCFALALYGFAVFGYFTAALASFFVGQDAASSGGERGEATALRAEIEALRTELRARQQERG